MKEDVAPPEKSFSASHLAFLAATATAPEQCHEVALGVSPMLLWDRGFTGFVLMAAVRVREAHFLGRCSRASFQPGQDLFRLNRADSYHALKERVLDLLAGNESAEEVIRQLQSWFAANPVSVRPERKGPRRRPSLARSYQFQRHVRKTVY